MNRALALLACLIASFFGSLARADDPAAMDPTGVWRTEGRAYHYLIRRCGKVWCVDLAWTSDENVQDLKNPDPTKQSRRIVGMRVVEDAAADATNHWKGHAYWYGTGGTYEGFAQLIDKDTLRVTGCLIVCLSVNLYRLK